jgi:hypothetical protein
VNRKEGARALSQIEATYKANIINTAEYLKTKYKEDHFVNIVKSQENHQPNMNSTIKAAEKVTEELNRSNENSDINSDTKSDTNTESI